MLGPWNLNVFEIKRFAVFYFTVKKYVNRCLSTVIRTTLMLSCGILCSKVFWWITFHQIYICLSTYYRYHYLRHCILLCVFEGDRRKDDRNVFFASRSNCYATSRWSDNAKQMVEKQSGLRQNSPTKTAGNFLTAGRETQQFRLI